MKEKYMYIGRGCIEQMNVTAAYMDRHEILNFYELDSKFIKNPVIQNFIWKKIKNTLKTV